MCGRCRTDLEEAELLDWHRGKAGTVEHAHDVVMNELAGRVLPSQKLGANATHSLPVFPSQILASFLNLLIFGALLLIAPRLKRHGQLFAVFLILYAIARFTVESTRGDYYTRYAGLTISQVICLGVFPTGIILVLMLNKKPEVSDDTATAE